MANICFYFQVHQPFRVRKYSIFDVGKERNYFHEQQSLKTNNEAIFLKVAQKCYLPANAILLELLQAYPTFKIA
ncbi:alpha-amylase, partial [Candidatus Woesearchaeota archaeon]|nr:alpha-amylase [Candidatus Woesearchaeota archaeon]